MSDIGDAGLAMAAFLILAVWVVFANLVGMVLVLVIKPKGRNRFGRPGKPCNFVQSIQACSSQYASFAGRAGRSEFWWFFLLCFVISIILNTLDAVLKTTIFHYGNFGLFLPILAVTMRRLHDIKRSGWWVLLNLAVLPVTLYVLLAWPADKSDEGVAQVFE